MSVAVGNALMLGDALGRKDTLGDMLRDALGR